MATYVARAEAEDGGTVRIKAKTDVEEITPHLDRVELRTPPGRLTPKSCELGGSAAVKLSGRRAGVVGASQLVGIGEELPEEASGLEQLALADRPTRGLLGPRAPQDGPARRREVGEEHRSHLLERDAPESDRVSRRKDLVARSPISEADRTERQLVQAWMRHADVQTTMKYMDHRSRAGDARLLSAAFAPRRAALRVQQSVRGRRREDLTDIPCP